MSLLNCDLCSLQNRHSRKQQNLSYLSPKEKCILLVQLKISFYVLFYVSFDISQGEYSNSEKIWVFWGLTKDNNFCIWKYFFTVSRNLSKISPAKYIFVTFLLSNCDLWSVSNRFLWKEKNLRFLRPNKRNT